MIFLPSKQFLRLLTISIGMPCLLIGANDPTLNSPYLWKLDNSSNNQPIQSKSLHTADPSDAPSYFFSKIDLEPESLNNYPDSVIILHDPGRPLPILDLVDEHHAVNWMKGVGLDEKAPITAFKIPNDDFENDSKAYANEKFSVGSKAIAQADFDSSNDDNDSSIDDADPSDEDANDQNTDSTDSIIQEWNQDNLYPDSQDLPETQSPSETQIQPIPIPTKASESPSSSQSNLKSYLRSTPSTAPVKATNNEPATSPQLSPKAADEFLNEVNKPSNGNTSTPTNAPVKEAPTVFPSLINNGTAPQQTSNPPPRIVSPSAPSNNTTPVQTPPAPVQAPPTRPVPAPIAIPQQPSQATPPPYIPQPAQQAPEYIAQNDEPDPNDLFLIKFNNVGIVEYLNFISRITKKNFIFNEEDMGFNVTIVSNEPTTINNIMTALLQELRIHGLSLMEVDNNLIIHSNPAVNSPPFFQRDINQTTKTDLVTTVFKLTNTIPDRMADIIRPLLSEMALISVMPESGYLIVTDLTSNVERIKDLVEDLDATSMGFEIGQYVLTNTSVEIGAELAEKILRPIAQGKLLVITPDVNTNSIFIVSSPGIVEKSLEILSEIDVPKEGRRAPGYGRGGGFYDDNSEFAGPDADGYYENLGEDDPNYEGFEDQFEQYLSPTERAQAEALRQSIIRRGGMDPYLEMGGSAFERIKYYIYKLANRPGDRVQESLLKIAGSLQGADLQNTNLRNANLVSALNNTQWIEETNSIIISGNIESIEGVIRIIEQIDVPVRQVFIEMLILQTTIDDSINFGVDWISGFGNPDSAGAQGFLSSSAALPGSFNSTLPGNTPTVLGVNANTGTAASSSLIQNGTFSMGIIGRSILKDGISYGSIGALVSALHSDTRTEIIMNPKIIVEENTTAEIFVGINTSFQTQSIANNLGTILTSNFEYRDIGSKLKVTPYISNGNVITLDIQQELSNETSAGSGAGGGSSSGTGTQASTSATSSAAPTTQKTTTTTRVHVPDSFFLVMSGMIQDVDRYTRLQVPCLGGIPLVGALFSQQKHTDSKNNLMIFIRPHIVEDCEIHRTTKRQQDIYKTKNLFQKRWQREVDETLQWMNVKPNYDPDYMRW